MLDMAHTCRISYRYGPPIGAGSVVLHQSLALGRHSTLIDPQSRSDERHTHFGPCNVATSQLASLKRPDLTSPYIVVYIGNNTKMALNQEFKLS